MAGLSLIQEPSAAAVGHVISAERYQPVLRRGDVDAALLKPFKIYIPRILKSHAGDAQRMAQNAIEQVQ